MSSKRAGVLTVAAAAVFVALIPAAAAANPTTDDDIAFLAVLRSNHVYYHDPDAMVRVGHDVCSAIAAGDSEQDAVQVIVNGGSYTAHDAAFIVGAAVAAYCPEFR